MFNDFQANVEIILTAKVFFLKIIKFSFRQFNGANHSFQYFHFAGGLQSLHYLKITFKDVFFQFVTNIF